MFRELKKYCPISSLFSDQQRILLDTIFPLLVRTSCTNPFPFVKEEQKKTQEASAGTDIWHHVPNDSTVHTSQNKEDWKYFLFLTK